MGDGRWGDGSGSGWVGVSIIALLWIGCNAVLEYCFHVQTFFWIDGHFSHGYLFFRGPMARKGRLLVGQGKVHVGDAEAKRTLV